MGNPNDKLVYVTWSGGIDSTALIGQLLRNGWEVQPITLVFGERNYLEREAIARGKLMGYFHHKYPRQFGTPIVTDGSFLSTFSFGDLKGADIPRRNRHILDYLMCHFVIPANGYYVGMGEYIGADTWVVKDHVGAQDADSRYLAAYLLTEYGLGYRFMALNDFGESRYKSDRVRLLIDAIGPEYAQLTSNCMFGGTETHCGKCYKCVERHVAFEMILGPGADHTWYEVDPKNWPHYDLYVRQMHGEPVNLTWSDADV